ncbi:MAG: hypothetical protein RMJ28_06960 [Nitrososphaerota archaeon]|nr:hypothetical protein [Candidatus Calditenuaceae archaeon]MDW8073953.1 hypothetical protein [Nitrososphaerota archaeon]
MYASVRDIRVYNEWLPVRVEAERPELVGTSVLRLSRRPLVDGDFDGSVLDDVEVSVDGADVEAVSVDAERGLVALAEPVPAGSEVSANYFWHPVSDSEIRLAVAKASAEVELVTGRRYQAYRAAERVLLNEGSRVRLRDRILAVESVRVYDSGGELIDDAPEFVVEDAEQGLLRLRQYAAGSPSGPLFLPTNFEVEVTYMTGYTETPEHIKQYTILAASYEVLLRFQRMLQVEGSYGEVALVVKSPEGLRERLEYLREEIERFRRLLPKPVRRV